MGELNPTRDDSEILYVVKPFFFLVVYIVYNNNSNQGLLILLFSYFKVVAPFTNACSLGRCETKQSNPSFGCRGK